MADKGSRKETTKSQRDQQSETQRSSANLQAGRESQPQTGLSQRQRYSPSTWGGRSMRPINREFDQLFEDFLEFAGFGRDWMAPFGGRSGLGRGAGEIGRNLWSPQLEVFERGGQLIVHADLPGMNREDVKVDVVDNMLVIQGERRQQREEDEEGYYRSERSYGSFHRSIPLPEGVNEDEIKATFRDGVLQVTMPAPQRQQRGRRIEIGDRTEEEAPKRARAQTSGR